MDERELIAPGYPGKIGCLPEARDHNFFRTGNPVQVYDKGTWYYGVVDNVGGPLTIQSFSAQSDLWRDVRKRGE